MKISGRCLQMCLLKIIQLSKIGNAECTDLNPSVSAFIATSGDLSEGIASNEGAKCLLKKASSKKPNNDLKVDMKLVRSEVKKQLEIYSCNKDTLFKGILRLRNDDRLFKNFEEETEKIALVIKGLFKNMSLDQFESDSQNEKDFVSEMLLIAGCDGSKSSTFDYRTNNSLFFHRLQLKLYVSNYVTLVSKYIRMQDPEFLGHNSFTSKLLEDKKFNTDSKMDVSSNIRKLQEKSAQTILDICKCKSIWMKENKAKNSFLDFFMFIFTVLNSKFEKKNYLKLNDPEDLRRLFCDLKMNIIFINVALSQSLYVAFCIQKDNETKAQKTTFYSCKEDLLPIKQLFNDLPASYALPQSYEVFEEHEEIAAFYREIYELCMHICGIDVIFMNFALSLQEKTAEIDAIQKEMRIFEENVLSASFSQSKEENDDAFSLSIKLSSNFADRIFFLITGLKAHLTNSSAEFDELKESINSFFDAQKNDSPDKDSKKIEVVFEDINTYNVNDKKNTYLALVEDYKNEMNDILSFCSDNTIHFETEICSNPFISRENWIKTKTRELKIFQASQKKAEANNTPRRKKDKNRLAATSTSISN